MKPFCSSILARRIRPIQQLHEVASSRMKLRQAAASDRRENSLAFNRLTSAESSSTSDEVRSVSGERTGPESRPITFIPALIIETA
jgi:hypothetical protein